jgi:hypothetical protein
VGAGRPKKASRVLGRDGRTLHNIIEDAIIKIRTIKNMCGQGESASCLLHPDVARNISHREGLLSSNSLWTLELELPDFKVVAMSEVDERTCLDLPSFALSSLHLPSPSPPLCPPLSALVFMMSNIRMRARQTEGRTDGRTDREGGRERL